MRFVAEIIVLAFGFLAYCEAQSSAEPQFEVASVKLAAKWSGNPPPPTPGITGGPGTPSPERLIIRHYPLPLLIRYAYSVKPPQFAGPAWLEAVDFNGDTFDIDAVIPKGTTKEQVLSMLQNLLRERFGLTFHHEQREAPIYSLVVAKGGPKMTESPKVVADADVQPTGKEGADGFPIMPAGYSDYTPKYFKSTIKWKFSRFSMAKFADMLWGVMNLTPSTAAAKRLVVDRTSLTGTYDFYLEYALMDSPPPVTAGDASGADAQIPAENLFQAVQSQLGLKLTPEKAPVDFFVVDRIERRPTAN